MNAALGKIATFYSYKGGTGRSMALANFAWTLAASGKRVLAIDWDLEAPGLHRYFRPFLIDQDLLETDGLIDVFWQLAAKGYQTAVGGSAAADRGNDREAPTTTLFDDVTRRLDCAKYFGEAETSGYIDFICAGRQSSAYSERVNTFDWRRFYELGAAAMLEAEKVDLKNRYDWVLIDSRTGVSDTSGISTMQMPDIVVPCFTLNRQSIDGVAAVLRSIRAYRSASVDGDRKEFFPVATRIENAEQKLLEAARRYARRTLSDFLPSAFKGRATDYWIQMEIAYRPRYAFQEVLAAFGDANDDARSLDSMLAQFERIARVVAGEPLRDLTTIDKFERDAVVEAYALDPSIDAQKLEVSPKSEREGALQERITLSILEQIVRSKLRRWSDSGYRWQLLLSRSELAALDYDANFIESDEDIRQYSIASRATHRLFGQLNLYYFVTWPPAFALAVWLNLQVRLNLFSIPQPIRFSEYGFDLLIILASWAYILLFGAMTTRINSRADRTVAASRQISLPLLEFFLLALEGPFRAKIRDFSGDYGRANDKKEFAVRDSIPAGARLLPSILIAAVLAFMATFAPDVIEMRDWLRSSQSTGTSTEAPVQSALNLPLPHPPAVLAPVATELQVVLTSDILRQIMPGLKSPEAWTGPLNLAMAKYAITTREREAMFLSQLAFQTDDLARPTMPLSFTSAEGLVKIWPGKFPDIASAKPYLREPENLANYLFADWRGNGNEASGDGWNYRPRGLLRGKDDYAGAAREFRAPTYLTNPDSVTGPEIISLTSAWEWVSRGENDAVSVQAQNHQLGPWYFGHTIAGEPAGNTDFETHWARAVKALGVPKTSILQAGSGH